MDATRGGGLEALPQLSNLVDPVRRRLYDHVVAQPGPVTREEAAASTGIARTLAAYHLDKLVDARLLDAGYARPAGRKGGPGAGRPAKQYRLAAGELSVTVPARSYLLMANLLAAAVESDETGQVRAVATQYARQTGRAAAVNAGGELDAALRDLGFEPWVTVAGDVELRNCPFDQLSATHTALVCSLNLDLVGGLLEGTGERAGRAQLVPAAGRCCVVVNPSRDAVQAPRPQDRTH